MSEAGRHYFFCGIGGSGMMPLAMIVAGRGGTVAGSDRSLDQGRVGEKFAALETLGIGLFAQDGSGPQPGDIFVASAAIEETVPDVVAANRLGLKRMSRAELLAELFNASPVSIAVGGTSGKSTVTGMIGWILDRCGRDPTIMNGAVMKNYASPQVPFASARVGKGDIFVSEVDESDGTIALYRPTIAVLNNVSVDHKSIEELRALFGGFLDCAGQTAINVDDAEVRALAPGRAVTFGLRAGARLRATDLKPRPDGIDFSLNGMTVALHVPGAHNVSNALAALAAAQLADIPLHQAAEALESFMGLNRRMDVAGTANGVTVIDDFGHNPDKIAATLDTLHAFPGRLLLFFQPHGYGPLRLMGDDLARTFREKMANGDRLAVCDPAYFGGTVDRSIGSDTLVAKIGDRAYHIPVRAACGDWLVAEARPGDRVVVMGARDDTLSVFAKDVLQRIAASGSVAAQ
jgi:UDP-N-acetylmuramate--alanine ligase